ncbi:ATP-binding cassette domain-containing protein, partial [Staphylococcus aureus]|uniref:ATP-binding cassette domain-containing protein n=1 Tax=Staphylococcus aureus TaxID=1280 RepID=UPI0039BE66D1
MTFGDFAAFNSYLAILIFPIFVLGFVSSIMAQASASYGRVAAVLAVPEPTPRGALRPAELRGAITVEHLTLTIGEKNILKDISFSIQQGSKTAIVGPTAAGKSQLLYALIGLIESTSGV